ncbi:hypothetical protein QQS21_008063 [Conoideocrella luteorostrata]|uniref:Pentatricopeptide repeat protein n=1 Tax=Conoideocrella luteorostrata TaxID=1105319 RepID=A0AAJ0FRI5_9HYPO|nr:hypothetical protein QQS21_008063 [Conoideocrella luteorostrata]
MAASCLSCRACLVRAIQLAAYGGTAGNILRMTADQLGHQSGRAYTTASHPAATTRPVDAPRTLGLPDKSGPIAEPRQKLREKMQRAVKKHLSHMEDPWKIAQHVEQTLAKDRYDEALLLARKVSKDRQVVVAWNHLIEYQLEQQQLKQAVKLYNEMKKRGQLPNVQTFTIIFRGCARSRHPKLAVAEAVKHYNILMADKRLQPNSIHLNAVLNVCARAGDLDSMFLIADTANDSTRAPTAFTYTTILNALRHSAIRDIKDLTQEQQASNLRKTVDRAKGLWMEVMDKWKQGRVIVDEELVCAMGRVLLLEPKREDKREVLDLLQQTMNIPNLANTLGSDSLKASDKGTTPSNGVPNSSTSSKALYAVPGRNTLALLLTTLASSKLTTVGIKYWNIMIRQYGIVPDNDNWLRMFGMLKVAKASAHSASTLQILPDEFANPKPYQIAMETCVRDNINTNVTENSTIVLNSMMDRLSVPDIHTLRLYLRVALVSHYHLRTRAQSGNEKGAKREYGVQITTALARLWEPYKKVHHHYFKTAPPPNNKKDQGILYNNKREVIALARLMFSAFNKVVNEGMLPEKDLRELRSVGAKINREIQAFYSNREQIEPRLRRLGGPDFSKQKEAADTIEDPSHRPGRDFVWDTTKTDEPVSLGETAARGATLSSSQLNTT